VFVIEFKHDTADQLARLQVEDYGMELATSHRESRHFPIIPILCTGNAREDHHVTPKFKSGYVNRVSVTNPNSLARAISIGIDGSQTRSTLEDGVSWTESPYEPIPTIVEAATTLFAGHSVDEISRTDSSIEDLNRVRFTLESIARDSVSSGSKAICFVTGVPGAGKTLAGLSIAHSEQFDRATFLSGNGPLVKVLSESLKRDLMSRTGVKSDVAKREATTFISNVHVWLKNYLEADTNNPPFERMIVFDEAQRAWDSDQSWRKFRRSSSEPEAILGVMNRLEGSCVVVALVGGGQEINTGEAGLAEWGRALSDKFKNWKVYAAPEAIEGGSSTAGSTLFDGSRRYDTVISRNLHLRVSKRTVRGDTITAWVEHVIKGDNRSEKAIAENNDYYPLVITRDLSKAKEWLKSQAKGLRRSGLIASSGARRLRPHGINVVEDISNENWFLNPKGDIRSSTHLELVATEFSVQGLELDWTGLCWGADFRFLDGQWQVWNLSGTKWQKVKSADKLTFVPNKYRVLLTRAREGLIVFCSPGDKDDMTRLPEFYDGTYDYLVGCGMQPID